MTILSKKIIPNVICTFCGSTCDDLQITVEDEKVLSVRSGCSSSLSKYLNYNADRHLTPLVRKNGELGGYKWGLERKLALLRHERKSA